MSRRSKTLKLVLCKNQLELRYYNTADTYFELPISLSGYVFNCSMYSSASVANSTCFPSTPAILFQICCQGDTADNYCFPTRALCLELTVHYKSPYTTHVAIYDFYVMFSTWPLKQQKPKLAGKTTEQQQR